MQQRTEVSYADFIVALREACGAKIAQSRFVYKKSSDLLYDSWEEAVSYMYMMFFDPQSDSGKSQEYIRSCETRDKIRRKELIKKHPENKDIYLKAQEIPYETLFMGMVYEILVLSVLIALRIPELRAYGLGEECRYGCDFSIGNKGYEIKLSGLNGSKTNAQIISATAFLSEALANSITGADTGILTHDNRGGLSDNRHRIFFEEFAMNFGSNYREHIANDSEGFFAIDRIDRFVKPEKEMLGVLQV